MPEPELERALRAAVAAQLIVADPDGGYEFRHALVREAVHDDLLPGEHARLHARYAAAIEAEPHLVAAGRAPAEIAHHWYAAHDHPRALVGRPRARPTAASRRTRTPSRPGCWSGCSSCGSRCRTPPSCSAWTTSTLLEETPGRRHRRRRPMRALSLTRAAPGRGRRRRRAAARRPAAGAAAASCCGYARQERRHRPSCARRTSWPQRATADPARGRAAGRRGVRTSARVDGTRAAEIAAGGDGRAADEAGDDVAQVSARDHLGRVCAARTCAPTTACPGCAAPSEIGPRAPATCRAWCGPWSTSPTRCSRWAGTRSRRDGGARGRRRRATGSASAAPPASTCCSNHAEALIALGRWDEADARAGRGGAVRPARRARRCTGCGCGPAAAGPRPRRRRRAGAAGRWPSSRRPYVDPQVRLPLHVLRRRRGPGGRRLGEAAETAAAAALADAALDDNPRYALAGAGRRRAGADGRRGTRCASRSSAVAEGLADGATRSSWRARPRWPAALVRRASPSWQAAVEAWRADGQPYPLARALLALAAGAGRGGGPGRRGGGARGGRRDRRRPRRAARCARQLADAGPAGRPAGAAPRRRPRGADRAGAGGAAAGGRGAQQQPDRARSCTSRRRRRASTSPGSSPSWRSPTASRRPRWPIGWVFSRRASVGGTTVCSRAHRAGAQLRWPSPCQVRVHHNPRPTSVDRPAERGEACPRTPAGLRRNSP